MADKQKHEFTYTQLAEILVKEAGIREGYWGLSFEFGLGGANIVTPDPAGEMVLRPSAIIPINKVGIQRFDGPNGLTVNAADVNPKASSGSRSVSQKKKRSANSSR